MPVSGYIVIPNWERFQQARPNATWIKLHLDLLGNDAWFDLSPADRCLLITIWMLAGRYGNGRVKADRRWLQGQANLPLSNRYRGLERLNHAGFIEFIGVPRAGATREEGSKEPIEEKRARPDAAKSGTERRSEEEPAAWSTAPDGLARLGSVFNRGDLAA